MGVEIREPILVVGLGGAGARLAVRAGEILRSDVLAISNDQADLQAENSIKVSTAPVINPSVQLIRGSAYKAYDEIKDGISGYSTIIIVANLAGRAGSALAPVVLQACMEAGKEAMSFAIMPFRYEKDRIFNSGITLKRLTEGPGCTIVLDNDAMLESNPGLSPKACYNIGNNAILHIVGSLLTAEIDPEVGIITTGAKSPNAEESLRDALKMLYDEAPPGAVKRSIIHLAGGNDMPVGILNSIADITKGVLSEGDSQVDLETHSSDKAGVVMLSTVQGMTKFDGYDPLGTIPREKTLDWSEPECSMGHKMDLYQLE